MAKPHRPDTNRARRYLAPLEAARARVAALPEEKEWQKELGMRIEKAARQAGLSLRGLAEAVGVTWASASNWSRGEAAIKASLLRRVAAAVGLTLAELLDGVEEATGEGDEMAARLRAIEERLTILENGRKQKV